MGGLDELRNDWEDDEADERTEDNDEADCSFRVISGVLFELRPLFNSFSDWFVVDWGEGEDEAATEFILGLLW